VSTRNYFQGSSESPYHISIGAVIKNKDGKIGCHYFKKFIHETMGEFENFYLLMRETIEPHESIEKCLSRGLMEEFGAEGDLKLYMGSIVSNFTHKDVIIEKTTLYFLCDLVSFDPAKRSTEDIESNSEIMWLDKGELIDHMKEQSKRLHREDLDESVVLERFK